MRYVKIPAPVSIPSNHTMYLWTTFLDEFIWASTEWHSDASSLEALVRAHAIADGVEGSHVAISDEDHERVWKLLRAAQIPGAAAYSLAPFCLAIASASSAPPPAAA